MNAPRSGRAINLTAAVLFVALLGIAWHVRVLPESYPMSDTATTSLYTLRASQGSLVTGAYSRFGWHHPGPLLYQMLAPAYRLSGYREASLKWSMTLINVACLAVLVVVGGRRSPRLTVCLVTLLTPLLWHEQRMVFWSWNPVAALIPLTVTLLLAGAVAAGSFSLLPVLVLLLSLIAQAHVGVAPIALVVALVAAFGAMAFHRTGEVRAPLLKWVGLSTAIAFLVWFVPLVLGAGNLREIWTFWFQPHPRQPWSEVFNSIAVELSVPFAWSRELITGDHVTAEPWQRVWAVAFYPLLTLSAAAAFRRGERTEGWYAVACLAPALAAPLLIRSIVGEAYEYVVFWLGIVSIGGTASILAMVVRPLTARSRLDPSRLTPLLVAWLVVVFAVTAWRIDYKQRADSPDHTTFHLAAAFEQYANAHRASVPLLSFSSHVWHIGTGLVLQIVKRGLPVKVAEDQLFLVGDEFRAGGQSTVELYLMAVDEELPAGITRHEWLTTVSGYRLIRIWRR